MKPADLVPTRLCAEVPLSTVPSSQVALCDFLEPTPAGSHSFKFQHAFFRLQPSTPTLSSSLQQALTSSTTTSPHLELDDPSSTMATPGDSDPGPDRPFRFLDLAPELRNNIYELALTHDPEHQPPLHATPALLRTCKLVYDEARDLFYARSTIHVAVECIATDYDQSSTTTRISGNGFDPTTRMTPPSILELYGAFPRHVTEIGTLRVTTRLARGFETSFGISYHVFTMLNRFFYALAARYRRGRLELTLESQDAFQSRSCTQWDLFWPIAKVKPDVELHLAGFGGETESRITSLRRNREAAEVLQYDILEDWQCFVSKLNLRQLRPGANFKIDVLRAAEGAQSSYQATLDSKEWRMSYDDDEQFLWQRGYLTKYFANYLEIAKRGAPK